MQNITKMRIIYSAEFNAEKEYLKTFFDYIGILVHDEKILNSQLLDVWYKHLKTNNDLDGVDIVLNYYTADDVPTPLYNKRIYLYFDIEKKICDISNKPLSNPNVLLDDKNMNISKKELRSKALDLLIDEIWQYDKKNEDSIKNKDTIKLIKECYIPKNEDSDLFYILQAIYSCIYVNESYVINSYNKQLEKNGSINDIIEPKLFLKGYVIKFFEELWKVRCLLNDNDSPYAIYTTINNEKLLFCLYKYLSESQKSKLSYISYNNTPLQIVSDRKIADKIYKLISNCPWFTNAMYMGLSLGVKSEKIYEYLLYCCSESSFPIYYAPVYNFLGNQYLMLGGNYKKSVEMFRKTLEIAPDNYEANFKTALLKNCEGNFILGNYLFENSINNLGCNSDYSYLLSLSELLKSYQVCIMISQMAINSYNEYTARGRINKAFVYVNYYEEMPLIKKIADNGEKSYQDFIQYHKYSSPVYTLYSFLQPWINTITNDHCLRDELKERLSKWDSDKQLVKK